MKFGTFATPHVLGDETTALRYVVHLLSCARSVRLGPLAEHLTRSLEAASAAPAQTASLLDEPRFGPSLDEQLAPYAETFAGLVTGFDWTAPSGSDEHPAGRVRTAGEFQRRIELENLIANAHALRVVFTWDADHPWLGGAVWRTPRPTAVRRDLARPPEDFVSDELRATGIGPVVIYLNSTLPGDQVFNVLLHELAHLLLAHVGHDPLAGSAEAGPHPKRSEAYRPLRELEAESVAIIAGSRRCAMRHEGFTYVRHFFDLVRRDQLMPFVGFVRVFVVAEILIAWCRTRPDRDSVERAQRVVAPRLPNQRARKQLVDQS
jgi:hypothetical protein